MKQSIPQNKLAALLAQHSSMMPDEADRFITEFFRLTTDALKDSGDVEISSFGHFIASENSVIFSPDADIAATVNEPFSFFEPVELKDEVTEVILDEATRPVQQDMSAVTAMSTSGKRPENSTVKADPEIPTTQQNSDLEYYVELPAEPQDKDMSEADKPLKDVDNASVKDEENKVEENHYPHEDSSTVPEIIYETVYQTRPWPVILGVIMGVIVGFIIGYLVHERSNALSDSSINSIPLSQEKETNKAVAYDADSLVEVISADSLSIPEDTVPVSAIETKQEVPVVYDTVTPHRFLATMAREHYGVMEYWIFIYEENKSSLPSNPNRITPGTRVIIPPVDKYVPSGNRAEGRAKAAEMIRQLEKNL